MVRKRAGLFRYPHSAPIDPPTRRTNKRSKTSYDDGSFKNLETKGCQLPGSKKQLLGKSGQCSNNGYAKDDH
jgi:hypothetical protein